jgi:polar amino acid transport system permease protein
VITSILFVAQSFIERHYSRGDRHAPASFWDFLRIRPKAGAPLTVGGGPTG